MLPVPTGDPSEQTEQALHYPSCTLTPRQLSDLEMLLSGAFAPLGGFLGQNDYQHVLSHSRLADGQLWPIPVMLDISLKFADQLTIGQMLAIRDAEGLLLALLKLDELWQADFELEAQSVFGTLNQQHPGVAGLLQDSERVYIAGKLSGVQLPLHYSFTSLWRTPEETRQQIHARQWPRVIAFQTSRIIHRVHRDFLLKEAEKHDASLLVHPSLGQGHNKAGQIALASRVHCYQAALEAFPQERTLLALSPLASRQAGPRETLWHALIEKNYGASHFLVGPYDSTPRNRQGEAIFYTAHEAQTLLQSHEHELGIQPICIEQQVYDVAQKTFVSLSTNKNGSVFREEALCSKMQQQHAIPEWWSFKSVIKALEPVYRPLSQQGFTVFFTGLSGSGKSTIAQIINAKLIELGSRSVTLLDGDIVRLNLSNELGFSRKHRDINVRRIGFVANEITKNGGVAICAPIAPYRLSRRYVRDQIEINGHFIEVHVSTSLAVCESRDRKGLYAKARQGLIPEFTGISDPYETPEQAELVIDTQQIAPLAAAEIVMNYLKQTRLIPHESR